MPIPVKHARQLEAAESQVQAVVSMLFGCAFVQGQPSVVMFLAQALSLKYPNE